MWLRGIANVKAPDKEVPFCKKINFRYFGVLAIWYYFVFYMQIFNFCTFCTLVRMHNAAYDSFFKSECIQMCKKCKGGMNSKKSKM